MNFKRIISLSLVAIMLVLSLASCNLQDIISGIMSSTTTTVPEGPTTDPYDEWAENYDIITVAEALEIAQGATTATAPLLVESHF